MSEETVTITKDEYIELLRCKAALIEKELAAAEPPPLPIPKPHSWMSSVEQAEILRLAALGLRSGEISKRIGRNQATVHRCIQRHRHAKPTATSATG